MILPVMLIAHFVTAGCVCEGQAPSSAPPAPAPVAPRGWNITRVTHHGTVTKIGARSIWLQKPGAAAREYPVVAELVTDKIPPGGRGLDDLYLLKDVRVGDRVGITCAEDGRTAICQQITIYRRPGGRVPPGYSSGPLRYHERMNAYQDHEEKGIAIPEKYQPQLNLTMP
jgi:hypothetical protein